MNALLILLLAYTSLVGLMLGVMLFFATVVTRTAFLTLPSEHGGTYLRAIFPVYYLWGIMVSLAMAGLAFATNETLFIITSIIVVLFVIARQILLPMIGRARDAKLAGVTGAEKTFKRLHLFSVLINVGQMLLLISVLIFLALNI